MRKETANLSDAFARAVKIEREKAGLSKAALAEKAGVHQTYIGMLEKGQRSPNLETANAIAVALKLPLSTLIRRAEKQSNAGAAKNCS